MAASQNKGTALYSSQVYGDRPSERTILGTTYTNVLPPTNISLGFIGFWGQLLCLQAAAVAYEEMQLYMLRLEKALQTSSHAEVPRFKIQAAGLGFRV